MKIWFIYQFFSNEKNPGHSQLFQYAAHLAKKHTVTVFKGTSDYMGGASISIQDQTSDKINYVNVRSTHNMHANRVRRLLHYLSFSFFLFFKMLVLKKPDVIFVSSPPLFQILPVLFASRIRGIPYVLEVRDLWPESIIQMGLLPKKIVPRVLFELEYLSYKYAKSISAITPGIKNDIVRRYPHWQNKIELVTCGTNLMRMPRHKPTNNARLLYNLNHKNTVIYFGALGFANDLRTIVEAAENLVDRSDIHIALIGKGAKASEIRTMISVRGLDNISVYDPVPKDNAKYVISKAKICLVTLAKIEIFETAIPTKLIDYLACGKPVINNVHGLASEIIDASKCGVNIEPENPEQLSQTIIRILNENELGQAASAYAKQYITENFDLNDKIDEFEKLLLNSVT